ncbi:MAG: FAD-binding oxidoreductase [Candidatus Omnitrophica bacterium]|nr:FAD-binding oxidoreductase [Candidatus Omnitrophota bacterium]
MKKLKCKFIPKQWRAKKIYRICPECNRVFVDNEETACPYCDKKNCPNVIDEMEYMEKRVWTFTESMRVKDKPYGYFRWSKSAFDEYNVLASCFALWGYNQLKSFGYQVPVSKKELAEWNETIHSWFNPKTHMLEDELLLKRIGRTKGYVNALYAYTTRVVIYKNTKCAGIRPLPVSVKEEKKRDVFSTIESTRKWLKENRRKNNRLYPCSILAQNLHRHLRTLKAMERRDDGVKDFVHKWLDNRQDKKTGYWLIPGELPSSSAAIDCFKLLIHLYMPLEWDVYYKEKIIDTTLALQTEAGDFSAEDPCTNFDSLYILYALTRQTDYRRSDIHLAAARSVIEMKRHWHEDECGFSFYRNSCLTGLSVLGEAKLAPARDEADIYSLVHWLQIPIYVQAILLGEDPQPKGEK